MTPATLQALRRFLFFSPPEAAKLIGGVTEHSWRYWERGKREVPADVIAKLHDLVEWRNSEISLHTNAIQDAHLRDEIDGEIPIVWYDTLEDWLSLPDRDPMLWRPHCSVVAQLCAEMGAVAVPFDADAYFAWLGSRTDSELMRSEWAAKQPTGEC